MKKKYIIAGIVVLVVAVGVIIGLVASGGERTGADLDPRLCAADPDNVFCEMTESEIEKITDVGDDLAYCIEQGRTDDPFDCVERLQEMD